MGGRTQDPGESEGCLLFRRKGNRVWWRSRTAQQRKRYSQSCHVSCACVFIFRDSRSTLCPAASWCLWTLLLPSGAVGHQGDLVGTVSSWAQILHPTGKTTTNQCLAWVGSIVCIQRTVLFCYRLHGKASMNWQFWNRSSCSAGAFINYFKSWEETIMGQVNLTFLFGNCRCKPLPCHAADWERGLTAHGTLGVGVKASALRLCSSSTGSNCALSKRGATQSRIQPRPGGRYPLWAKWYLSRFDPPNKFTGLLKTLFCSFYWKYLAVYF